MLFCVDLMKETYYNQSIGIVIIVFFRQGEVEIWKISKESFRNWFLGNRLL